MKKFILFLIGGFLFFLFASTQIGKLNAQSVDANESMKQDTVIQNRDSINIKKDTSNIESDSSQIADANTTNKTLTGIASFYSKSLEGTLTSTGEIFHHHKLTAASNNFNLNTWVKVTNLNNDKSIIVRINDHMSKRMQRKGRIIDLSIRGAKQLGFIKRGITKVRVEEVEPPQSALGEERIALKTTDSLQ